MRKNDAISRMNNSDLNDKRGCYIFFFLYIKKMSEKSYYKRNRDVILNGEKDYYENDKKY